MQVEEEDVVTTGVDGGLVDGGFLFLAAFDSFVSSDVD